MITKRLLLLNGLAILGVVLSHAAGWGTIAMFWWTDRYRPVSVPNYDQLGTVPYYFLIMIAQLTVWTVPAFLFVSGFFAAFMARGNNATIGWRAVRARLVGLLVPYLIWSFVIFVGDALDHVIYSPGEYLWRLLKGGAHPSYYFVPLLCSFYLISPWLVRLARVRWKALLLGAALVQLMTQVLSYLQVFGAPIPGLDLVLKLLPTYLLVWFAVYFPLGLICGLHVDEFKLWLRRSRSYLLPITILLGFLTIVEPEAIYRLTGIDHRWVALTIPGILYSVAFIFCFLEFGSLPVRFSKVVNRLGSQSYGIYLLHGKAIELAARLVYHISPWILAWQLLFQPILLFVGLILVLWSMDTVMRTPARRYARVLFG